MKPVIKFKNQVKEVLLSEIPDDHMFIFDGDLYQRVEEDDGGYVLAYNMTTAAMEKLLAVTEIERVKVTITVESTSTLYPRRKTKNVKFPRSIRKRQ